MSTVSVESTTETDVANTSGGSQNGSGGGKNSSISLTPRFTQEEKEILYSLFHQHEEVIDIKFRKKQRSKYSVRDTWDSIVREFNSHPNVSALRNLKQIQKFWLNARLRKQYPFRSVVTKSERITSSQQQQQQQQQQQEEDVTQVKNEPEFQIATNEVQEQHEQPESFEEIEMDHNGQIGDEEQMDGSQQQQMQQQQQQQQQIQHVQQTTTLQPQQISVDQISAEKLTLNDLLQFKTTRPREEIILQIKHPADAGTQITIPSPTRISIPTHHQPQQHTMATITAAGYNQQIISEIKPQQITLAQYQAQQQQQAQQQLQQQQQQLAQQQQQQLATQHLVAAAAVQQHQHQHQHQQQQQQQQQVKMQLQSPATQQYATATPTFTCTTFSAVPASAGTTMTVPTTPVTVATAPTAASSVASENFEDRMNYFRVKEAELRFKEEQVALDKKKIALNRAEEELKHMREIHRLQVEELKIKIRMLQEEEKQLRKNRSAMQS